nr:MAG: hypothetical protein [Gammatorquevirus sp.]
MSKFFKKTPYNNETKNQMWMSMIADGHDICCGCLQPFAHLLDSIFPEGHADRGLTVQQIIDRDYPLCHSGGDEEGDHGLVAGDSAATLLAKQEEEEDFRNDGDAEEFLAAAAAAEER